MHKVRIGSGLPLLLALALLSPIAAFAQTTVSSRVSEFELLAVDGNHLVVRDQNGTRELTVPPDFRFTVNGKAMAASELKAGMKGTAVITTTTTERPVYVTTVKKGTVVNQTGKSVVIKEDNGKVHRFTQSEVDSRGIQLFIGDAPKRLFDLSPGDQISATIVTAGKPEILTSQAVEAELAAAAAAPPPARACCRSAGQRTAGRGAGCRARAGAAGRGDGSGAHAGSGEHRCRARERGIAQGLDETPVLLPPAGDHHHCVDLCAHAQAGQEGRYEVAGSLLRPGSASQRARAKPLKALPELARSSDAYRHRP